MQSKEQEARNGLSSAPSLNDRLHHIRSSPNLQSQKQSAIILSAVEDTLKEQKSDFTPTAYFAALLSLLNQYVSSSKGIANKDLATAVVYLLDLVTPHVPAGLLRSKFSQILTSLAPALSHQDADGPFMRAAIGCLVSLLLVQNSQAWALPQTQVSPRQAVAALLSLAADHRPKIRKRAQNGLAKVLQNPPPSPSLDHPAADMCAETALQAFEEAAGVVGRGNKPPAGGSFRSNDSELIHSMQLVKAIASSCGGWPSRSLDPLCQVLLSVARSKSEHLTSAAFEVFESIFAGMANEQSASKLPQLLEAVRELQPPQNDTQLYPPWLAIISRGYDVSAQVEPDATLLLIPDLFKDISEALASPSYNIRVSSSECLISLLANCVPHRSVQNPSSEAKAAIEALCSTLTSLLSVKYQSSWMEVFAVLGAAFDALKSQSFPALSSVISVVGDLRAQDGFSGKEQADELLSKAIQAVKAENFLSILPLNLINPPAGEQGRAWIVPLLRDSVRNDYLSHFKNELLPLKDHLSKRLPEQPNAAKTMETKIFETLVSQLWDALPGYCDVPLDLNSTFDEKFAEKLADELYQTPERRATICRALQNLVDSNKAVAEADDDDQAEKLGLTKEAAQRNITHLANIAQKLLAVLFNTYTQTSPQQRGSILECIDSYLSISSEHEVSNTFNEASKMLDQSMRENLPQQDQSKQAAKESGAMDQMHAIMDLVVTVASYLPRESFQALFNLASAIIGQKQDASLQKKAYRLIPRLAQSEIGKVALQERNAELRQMLLNNADNVLIPARRDRLNAISKIVKSLPHQELHFIASVLPEIILCTKDNNERTRNSSFDLLILIGQKMKSGGTIDNSNLNPANPAQIEASVEEYLTMLSAGLAGTTPHMISASVTAITRVFYAFHEDVSEATAAEIVSTMDLFLKSPSREVVRSVLGFVKVAVLSLPIPFMQPRLQTLIPNLMPWSHEHKGHFKAKVKNILERMIRRFGVDIVDRYCPEEDRKLIANIRKTRDRKKRGKAPVADDEEMEDGRPATKQSSARYNNEFDEAIYGSDSDADSDADQDSDMDSDDARAVQFHGGKGKGRKKNQATTYIREDSDEPLDLLDRRALGNISSQKPVRRGEAGEGRKKLAGKAKTDEDGKFVFNGQDNDDDDDDDMDVDDSSMTLERGINAYVDAIRGRDAAKRGQRGRLKFTNKPHRSDGDEEDEDKDWRTARRRSSGSGEERRGHRALSAGIGGPRGHGSGGSRGGFSGRGQIASRGRNLSRMHSRGGGGVFKQSGSGRGRGRGVGKIGKMQRGPRFGAGRGS